MRINYIIMILLLVVTSNLSAQSVKHLSPQDFDKMLSTKKAATLLDVRTSEEYAQGHLPNAKLLDYYSNDFKTKASKLDKSKPVLLYCKAGSRSNSAAAILLELGFKEVYDLEGGIGAWRQANKAVVK